MNWIKKGEASSVKEVFLRNTGYSDDDLERIEKETYPITGFDKAKDILLKAIKKGEKVTVVADYDDRLIVRNGLKDASAYAYLLPKGFYTLISSFYLLDHISEKDVGFKIAPAINACGRLCDDGGAKILRALLENNEGIIDDVIATNERRKILTRDLTEKAEMAINAEGLNDNYPLLLYIPKAPLGIIGLVASAVSEKYKKPAFVVSDCGDILKGSGRTYGNKNIKQMLDDSSEFLLGYGGHAAAAGISLKKEDLDNLRKALSKAYGEIEEPDPNVYYDLEINEASFKNILDELEKYMPYGEGNPEIVFRINNYKIHPNHGRDYILMGKDRSIIKFQGINSDAIGFDCLPKYEMLGKPDRLNLIGTLSYNYFRGSRRATIEIIDIECA